MTPVAERVVLRLESHLPQILFRLRPSAEAERALEQFGATIDAARARRTAVEVEIPLAPENASTLPETIAWVARAGVVLIRVVPFRARAATGREIDVFSCLSDRYLARVESLSEQIARDAGIPFLWEPRAERTVEQYKGLAERVRAAVMGAVPAGAVCVVATKGDDRLLELGDAVGWHFPRMDDGNYAGFNPPDGRWAIEQLQHVRAAGAEYLVLPATAYWWRGFYPEFAQWLGESGRLVLEDRETCLIAALA